jgi:short-chain Z-isoprenyl diphosphate synthase
VRLQDLVYAVYERRLRRQLGTANRPRHVAVIMDGNRRWAKEVGFADVSDGHRVGAAKLVELLGWCHETGVEIATFWLLSPDNLRNRPPDQVQPLL